MVSLLWTKKMEKLKSYLIQLESKIILISVTILKMQLYYPISSEASIAIHNLWADWRMLLQFEKCSKWHLIVLLGGKRHSRLNMKQTKEFLQQILECVALQYTRQWTRAWCLAKVPTLEAKAPSILLVVTTTRQWANLLLQWQAPQNQTITR